MLELDCQCGTPIKGLMLGATDWKSCRNCGIDHRLVRRKAGPLLTLLLGLILASAAVGTVGRRLELAPLTISGFAVAAALGAYGLYAILSLLFNREGILSSRPTVVAESITRLTDELAGLQRQLSEASEETMAGCESALAELDEFTELPRQGEWLRGKAIALSGVSANNLGLTRNSRDYLNRLNQLPKAAKAFYWTTYFFSTVNDVSEAAVKTYFRVLNNPSSATDDLTESVRTALQKACAVRRDMVADELKNRIRWNQQAAKLFADATWPALNEATGWIELGRHSRCISVLQDQPADAEHWQAQLLLAQAEFKEGLTERAENRIRDLERWSSDRPEIAVEVALLHIRRDQPDRAKPFLEKCEAAGGEAGAKAMVIQARLHLRNNHAEKARLCLMQAIKADPKNVEAVILLSEITSADGGNAEAGRTLSGASKQHPKSSRMFVALARANWNAGEFQAAAEAFETGIRNGATPDSLAVVRAQCLLRLRRFEDAAAVLDQAIDVPEHDELQASFYHGVALLELARQNAGRGAARALPYFANAAKRAKVSGDKDSQIKARINSVNCYRMISEECFASGKFRESAKAWERLAKSFQAETDNSKYAYGNAAEALLRAAIGAVNADRNKIAIECLQQSTKMKRSTVVELMLGTVLFRDSDFSAAKETFDRLLADSPNDERLRFYRALSSVRAGESAGRDALRELLQESGKFRLRVALALADREAESSQYDAAAATLTTVLTNSEEAAALRKDRFFGEACCKAVLYTVRTGRASEARELIAQLLGGQNVSSEKILGAILAEVGDFAQALPVLREWVQSNRADENTRTLLTGVAIRVGMQHCEVGKFKEASEAVSMGLVKGADGRARLLGQLLDVAANDDGEIGELSERTVELLEKCAEQSKELSMLTARPIVVGAQVQMLQLARQGDYPRAEKFAARAKACWKDRIRKSSAFWRAFIETYNDGKDYQLDTPGHEVAKAVEQRLIGFWVRNLEKSIAGEFQERNSLIPGSGAPDFDAVRFCWNSLKSIVGAAQASELAKKHIDLLETVARIARQVGPEEAVRFVKFAEKEMYTDDRLAGFVANQAETAMLQSLADFDGNRFRQYLQELLAALSGDKKQRDACNLLRKIQSLGTRVQDRIFTQMSTDADLTQMRAANSGAHRQICFQTVVAFAVTQDNIPGGLQPSHVTMLYGKVKEVVWQAVANA